MTQWQDSLRKLLDAIPPPTQPRYVDGPLLDPSLPTLPEDHKAIINAYGSGKFVYSDIGCVIELFNPRDPWHRKCLGEDHDILRDYRESEGVKYMPYPVYPESPGVLICGWNDSRDYWFWHVNTPESKRWPTIFYGDMRDAFQFDMPMVVFMQKLFFGEIHRSELNFAETDFKPTNFEFKPTRRVDSPV
ncbi:hypothetical protein [Gimesia chilikensis]|uniref:hypothetical protein n=1 Tax=Gimesia chilikensis TaxID=2605989 RepID=UPI001188A735|nr:hypothetical protein [Gimesia chilikensis]QDT86388.1 hypothetical protein MalM14_40640 [Gimesia chilikensis]